MTNNGTSARVSEVSGVECAKCGKLNELEGRVCAHCGRRLYMHCRRCGVRNPRTAHSCSNCGRHLHKSSWGRFKRAVSRYTRGHWRYKILLVLLIAVAVWVLVYRLAAPSQFPDLPLAQ
jgi:ssDNA-binding Zn-finger/Zn-ribbon topoisomerase 1